jgi:hypothetical protein
LDDEPAVRTKAAPLGLVEGDPGDRVPLAARLQQDAVVEVPDRAVTNGHGMVAGVAHADTEAGSLHRVPVQVDRDAAGADHEPVAGAREEVVGERDAGPEELSASRLVGLDARRR